ncbi:MAG TPA: hypothetical protein VFX71_04885 [Hyphomicrobium sp.]|nr:hypothetical protein [Hyphomicrobium sp.]
MTTTLTRSLALATFAASALVASVAGASAHSIDQRSIEQRLTIEQGRQSGSITWLEGRRLRAEQQKIVRVEQALKSDGHLSGKDRRVLRTLQDQAEARIVAEQTDNRRRRFLPRIGN